MNDSDEIKNLDWANTFRVFKIHFDDKKNINSVYKQLFEMSIAFKKKQEENKIDLNNMDENVEPPELNSSDGSWIDMIEKMSFETESIAN